MMFINIDVFERLHDALSQRSARPWPPSDRRKGRKPNAGAAGPALFAKYAPL